MGIPNPDYLQGLPYRVLLDWQEYYEKNPFGAERDDIRIGYAISGLANVIMQTWSDKKLKKSQLLKPEDFIPEFNFKRKKKDEVSPDMQFAKVKLLNAMFGGEVIDKRGDRIRKIDKGSNS